MVEMARGKEKRTFLTRFLKTRKKRFVCMA
jgi:hypothetical protein